MLLSYIQRNQNLPSHLRHQKVLNVSGRTKCNLEESALEESKLNFTVVPTYTAPHITLKTQKFAHMFVHLLCVTGEMAVVSLQH
jgi:uroporphyrinogen-III synthase